MFWLDSLFCGAKNLSVSGLVSPVHTTVKIRCVSATSGHFSWWENLQAFISWSERSNWSHRFKALRYEPPSCWSQRPQRLKGPKNTHTLNTNWQVLMHESVSSIINVILSLSGKVPAEFKTCTSEWSRLMENKKSSSTERACLWLAN